MQTKVTLSGRHEAVDRLVIALRGSFTVYDPYEPKVPPLPTTPVCRTITVEVPTNIHSSRLLLTDTPAPYVVKEAA